MAFGRRVGYSLAGRSAGIPIGECSEDASQRLCPLGGGNVPKEGETEEEFRFRTLLAPTPRRTDGGDGAFRSAIGRRRRFW